MTDQELIDSYAKFRSMVCEQVRRARPVTFGGRDDDYVASYFTGVGLEARIQSLATIKYLGELVEKISKP